MSGDITQFVDLAVALWGVAGYWSIPILAVMLTVRVVRLDWVQARAPLWLVWDAWPRWGQWAAIGALSLTSSVATALVAGAGWGAAMWAAIPVAVGAVWGHKGTQLVGHVLHAVAARDPAYKPSAFRRAASIVVPLDPGKLRRAA